jgi:hypothetical protein
MLRIDKEVAMDAFLNKSAGILAFVVFVAFMAHGVALCFLPTRGDVSFFDIYRKLSNKYGFLWFITKPEAYWKKQYVKCALVINYVFVGALAAPVLMALMANRH